MNIRTNSSSRLFMSALGLLALSTLLMWLPALTTPLWGDDYVFLLHARAAADTPWWSAFRPDVPVRFWRPLSQEGYWRAMLQLTGGSALAMHLSSLLLHVLACLAVALLGERIARSCGWAHPRRVAACAGVVYASLALHLLPLHWAAAANSAMLVLFTSLALTAWLAATEAHGARRYAWLLSLPLLQALALLCKESAVLLPLLMIVTLLFTHQVPLRRGDIAGLLACVAIILAWLVLDAHFTAHTDQAYALTLGMNVPRNGVALVAWLLNVPREAVRMFMLGRYAAGLTWMTATALPMLAALALALHRQDRPLTGRQGWLVLVFIGLAYGPYFLFADHSYAYYAATAAILPVIVLAALCVRHPRAWLVLALLAASSWLAVAGSRQAALPALLARAHWGEALLQNLQHRNLHGPLQVRIDNPRRFYAVGRAGLAWRLGLPLDDIQLVQHCAPQVTCLRIDREGQARLATRQPDTHQPSVTRQ